MHATYGKKCIRVYCAPPVVTGCANSIINIRGANNVQKKHPTLNNIQTHSREWVCVCVLAYVLIQTFAASCDRTQAISSSFCSPVSTSIVISIPFKRNAFSARCESLGRSPPIIPPVFFVLQHTLRAAQASNPGSREAARLEPKRCVVQLSR